MCARIRGMNILESAENLGIKPNEKDLTNSRDCLLSEGQGAATISKELEP